MNGKPAETRKENLMRTLLISTALVAGLSAANAQTTQYFAPNGSYDGSAVQSGGTTNYFSANGASAGTAIQSGGTTQYFGPDGSYQGSAIGQ